MISLLTQLQRADLFSEAPADLLTQEVLPRGKLQEYTKDQFLFVPQQTVDQLGIVIRGSVHTLHLFPDGTYNLMATLSPGRVIGIDLVCTRTQIAPYHAAAASTVQVFWLPASLLTVPGTLPESLRLQCLQKLLLLLSHENMRKEYRLAILAQKSLRERILVYLTMQANRLQKDTFAIAFSREDMASYLCVNRSALSHELSLMQQEGLISFRKNRFTLHGWKPELP